ncbi:MAG: hypothetical protein A3I29_00840 [Candidatus Magasanikbacteria bacterium RIFCSPLOWO2_02_FULL_44_11]|uniref:Glycine zipper domain-containing protein n=1 Tax=Candidatus Magasanikbacteria bacterium RIFCSPLOWO2_02_FULL_44_11 TaxID=1798689 RepID=A0A1F6N9I9_9BACT|nr:MAG: hypothetical protein A3I29_00840 [Candidatus Magasanikbacteria bacterium RIFCSPLOWO2_02_FULL_44_11]
MQAHQTKVVKQRIKRKVQAQAYGIILACFVAGLIIGYMYAGPVGSVFGGIIGAVAGVVLVGLNALNII